MGVLAAALAGGLTIGGLAVVPALAATQQGIVPGSVSVIMANDTTPVYSYSSVKIKGQWTAPTGTAEGDTFRMAVSAPFTVEAGTTFPLRKAGDTTTPFANCVTETDAILCTYTAAVTAQPNVGGSFWFDARTAAANGASTYTFTVNGTDVTVTVPGGVQTPGTQPRPEGQSYCWFNGKTRFGIDARFPGGRQTTGTLTAYRGAFVPNSGQVAYIPASEPYNGANWQNITTDTLSYTISDDGKTLNFTYGPARTAGDTIRIQWAVALTPSAVNGEVGSCSASINGINDSDEKPYLAAGGGEGDGGAYAQPAAPEVAQAVCTGPGSTQAPTVTTATTAGISYTTSGTVAPGNTVTVTATADAANGYVLQYVDGWTFQNDTTATYEVSLDAIDCTEYVTPAAPAVTQAICTDGTVTVAEVTPATTAGIVYALVGTVAPGEKVVVTATPEAGVTITPTAGWTATENGAYSYVVVLDAADCTPVAPVNPGVAQAVCTDGETSTASVTPATTAGISYVMSSNVAPGETVTIVAFPAAGYALAETAGWVAGTDGTASTTVVLADVTCELTPPAAPKVTQGICTDGVLTLPTLVLEETQGLVYTTAGTPAPGSSVTVTATPVDGYAVRPTEGWTPGESGTFSTTVVFDNVECEPIIEGTPVMPTVTQAVCTGNTPSEPTVTLATTEDITYAIEGTVARGTTVTVVATPDEGYVLAEAAGWTARADGAAEAKITLADLTCATPPTTPPALATTGTDATTVALGGGLAAALLVAGALMFLMRRRSAKHDA